MSEQNEQRNIRYATLGIVYSIVCIILYFLYNNSSNRNNYWKNEFIKRTISPKIDHLQSYVKLHETIIMNGTKIRIVFNNNPDIYGYANRVYSVLSSLLIAILSDRALLINWKYIDSYIEPSLFKLFDVFNETNEYNYNYKSNEIEGFGFSQAWKVSKLIKIRNDDVLKYNTTRVKFEQITAFFFELCSYPQFYNKLLYYDLVSRETTKKAELALKNKTILSKSKEQDDVFKVGFEVGGNLMRRFWKPKKFIQDQIEHYYDTYFKGNFVIGLQLRFYYLNETTDPQVFINCAQKIESYFNETRVIKWFISSDSVDFISKIKKEYPDKVISTNGTIKNIAYNTLDGYNRTILDSELLSLCDRIVFTGGSTFGFLPAMKSLRLPYYVNGRAYMNECKWMRFSDATVNYFGYSVF